MGDGAPQQQGFLEDGRDAAMVGEGGEILPQDLARYRDRARGERQQARQRLQQRALAGAVRTVDADGLAGPHGEIGRVQRQPPAAAHADAGSLQQNSAHRRP